MSKAEELQAFIEQVKEENKTDVDRFVNDLKKVIQKNRLTLIQNKRLAISLELYARCYLGYTDELIQRVYEFESFKYEHSEPHSEDYNWCDLETAKTKVYVTYPTYNGPAKILEGIPTEMYEFCKKLEQEGFELWFIYHMNTYTELPTLDYALLVL